MIRHVIACPPPNSKLLPTPLLKYTDLSGLKNWWDKLIDIGPSYGYFPNPLKTRLIVKEEDLEKAEEVFLNTGIWVTTDGSVALGSPIGSESFMSSFITEMVTS